MHLAPQETRELKVEHERGSYQATAISSATPDFLFELTTNTQLSDAARRQLRAIGTLKQQIGDAQNEAAALSERQKSLDADQTRLRENIDSLNRVKGEEQQVREYSSRLAANELELGKLSGELHAAYLRKVDLEKQLREEIAKLRF